MAYKNKFDAVKYNNEYNKRAYDRINLTVPKGYREVIRETANASGKSVNEFIFYLVRNEIENTKLDLVRCNDGRPSDKNRAKAKIALQ